MTTSHPQAYPPASHKFWGSLCLSWYTLSQEAPGKDRVERGRVRPLILRTWRLESVCYPTTRMSRQNLLDLLPSEHEDLAESLGVPRYRGRQIASWLYGKGATDIEAMSDLPRDFRAILADRATVAVPEIERRTPSQDGSQKLVLRLEDGARIQSVLMPDADRLTLCVSTQVGCGFACAFCLTGTMDMAKRRHVYRDLARAMVEDATWVFLLQQVDIYASRERLTWTPRPDQWIPLHDASIK